jgi:hypothetical protein
MKFCNSIFGFFPLQVFTPVGGKLLLGRPVSEQSLSGTIRLALESGRQGIASNQAVNQIRMNHRFGGLILKDPGNPHGS